MICERKGRDIKSRAPALQQSGVGSCTAFTLGLFEIHSPVTKLVRVLGRCNATLIYPCVSQMEYQYLSHLALLNLLVWEIGTSTDTSWEWRKWTWALWRAHHYTHSWEVNRILWFKDFVAMSTVMACWQPYSLNKISTWKLEHMKILDLFI